MEQSLHEPLSGVHLGRLSLLKTKAPKAFRGFSMTWLFFFRVIIYHQPDRYNTDQETANFVSF